MNAKSTMSNASGFYIWFDKKNKKEYYSMPITLYKAKIHINKSHSYIKYAESYLAKVTPKRNNAAYVQNALNLHLIDLYNPYEERYGMFLINFLNARFDTFHMAYRDFFYAYSLELIDDRHTLKAEYKNEADYISIANKLFKVKQQEIIELQAKFRDWIDYIYNLNENKEDKEIDPYVKFQVYSLKYNMNQYTNDTEVVFNSMSIFKNDFVTVKLNELNQNINNGKINLQDGIKYKSTKLSNICFTVLNELVSNNTPIKVCKNCERYFIPVNRHAEVYCDLPKTNGEKTCRELGARVTYNKNIQEIEGLLIYRRTYQKRIMELSRNPNATPKEKEAFNNWKKSAQTKIKEFKAGKIDKESLNKWMRENKDL